jgi:hypothetical protein
MKRFVFLRGLVLNVPGPGILMRHNDEDDIYIPVRGDHVPPALPVHTGQLQPYEPMRESRFLLNFPADFNIPEVMIRATQRPSWTIDTWNDMKVVLYDPVGPSMAQSVYTLIQTEYINTPFTYKLQILDPVGQVIEEWFITGRIIECDFGPLSYVSNDICGITLIIRPNQDGVILNF